MQSDSHSQLNALSCLDGALLARGGFFALNVEMFGAGCGHVFGL